uniref:Uncharacterized protein n=1 Tax=Arundo donax TaxID=35708 RepID=A0A0A9BXH6_ARUDO
MNQTIWLQERYAGLVYDPSEPSKFWLRQGNVGLFGLMVNFGLVLKFFDQSNFFVWSKCNFVF